MPPRCAIVLAGGESRRMGRDKAFIEIDGETLAARTARVAGEICDLVIVVGAPSRPLPPLPDGVLTVFDDERFQGPLAGIVSGLGALPGAGGDHVLVVPVDMPRLRVEPLRALLSLAPKGRAVAVERDGRIEPLPAWLPTSRLREVLAAQRAERSLHALLRDLEVVAVNAVPGMESMRDADDAEALRAGEGESEGES